MNKRSRRKGFTTVELVIVIAVIAILATVLIPTFSNLIEKANESAALQEANSILKSYLIENAANTDAERDFHIKAKGYYFRVTDGKLQKDGTTTAPTESGAIIVSSTVDDPYYTTEPIAGSDSGDEHEHDYDARIGDRCTICNEKNPEHKCYDQGDGDSYCYICGEYMYK